MQEREIEHILASVKASLDHPLFYPRIFALVAKHLHKRRDSGTDLPHQVVAEEYEELSRRLDRSQIQESTSVRNVLRTRKIAELIIDDKGEINRPLLSLLISNLKEHLYSLGPHRQYEGPRQEHLLNALQLLETRKELGHLLKMFTRPVTNKWAEELIRQTLQLPPGTTITDAHTKRAVLAAWLCFLRQNVGSCFATAPAEIVHDEQPELFLQDLLDLIATGMLKRTYGGIENSVPLSASWGSGDLKKPLVIRLTSGGMQPEIWYSPGLMRAFELTGLLDSGDYTGVKVQRIEEWVKPIIQQKSSRSFSILTAEEIIRKVLLQSLGLTETQLKDYQNRPPAALQTQLFFHSTGPKQGGGIGEKCANFLNLFEAAKNAFKSISDNALLKAWEFTLASFSDIKYEFARWNLYASLGMQTNEPGGIGQCIYQIIQEKLEQANRKVQDIQYEYEMVYTQVKTLEARMRGASTEKEIEWLKIDYQSRVNEFHFLEESRNHAHTRSTALVNLYDTLYRLYVELFKNYFQEVYDADMQEISSSPFDDSPAGFRLVYKHGRSNSSLWTRVKNEHEYIDALTSFFVATEPQIKHEMEGDEIEKDLSDVVTGIINHIKTKEFLESAFHRMAIAHKVPLIKDPLDHMEHVEKKPWVYTSGGTMNTLVSCYYRIEDKPKEIEKWIESEMELLVFLADTIKQIPPRFIDSFLNGKRRSMLMQSPTHAFLLKPTLSPFKECWMHEEFTYTYIRDCFVRPMTNFVEDLLLNEEMIRYFVSKLCEMVPENFQPRFKSVFGRIEGSLSSVLFREYLVNLLQTDRGLRQGTHPLLSDEDIDGLLYSSLPLFPVYELRNRVELIFSSLPGLQSKDVDQLIRLFDHIPVSKAEPPFLGAQQLQDICKALLCLNKGSTSTADDYHFQVCTAARSLGFSMPAPILFADTNWVKDLFGFTVNPGTGKLELWRFDYTGSLGYPMTSWKEWVNGARPDLKWGVYIKPYEYGQY